MLRGTRRDPLSVCLSVPWSPALLSYFFTRARDVHGLDVTLAEVLVNRMARSDSFDLHDDTYIQALYDESVAVPSRKEHRLVTSALGLGDFDASVSTVPWIPFSTRRYLEILMEVGLERNLVLLT